MTCTCPACGKKTAIEADVGDFPSRCQRCSALLRAPAEAPAAGLPRGLAVKGRPAARSTRIEQGVLAGLLISDSREERQDHGSRDEAPRMIIRSGHASAVPVPEQGSPRRVLRPESLREIARVNARQKALRRAALRGNHQALGLLGKMGFALVVVLSLGALALEARVRLNPATAHADIIKSPAQYVSR
jgi:hypothetical protein